MRGWLFFTLLSLTGCSPTAPEAVAFKVLPPGIHQQSVDVPGLGNAKYTIEIPAKYDGKTPMPLIVFLHYSFDGPKPAPFMGKEMLDTFRAGLTETPAICVAPDALGGKWTDADNEKWVVWLTQSVMKSYAIDVKKVIITGYSLGGLGTWHIGARHQDLFTGAIPVAAAATEGGPAWNVPVYAIHSDADQVFPYPAAKSHIDALKASGAKIELNTLHGVSHNDTPAYTPAFGTAVKWLFANAR